ncbi:MAG: hypothetical protein ACMUJM_23140 [bacterium]
MISLYKKKILKEIEGIPEDDIPKLYKIIHIVTSELINRPKKSKKRGSLKGIWKGSNIDEKLFCEAKKSLFPYDYGETK